jgi:hypothetical protein
VAAVRAAGYLAATTTKFGFASPRQPRYELDRLRVDAGEGSAGVQRSLQAAATGAAAKPAGE